MSLQIMEIREAVEEATNSEALNPILTQVCLETQNYKVEVQQSQFQY